MTETPKNDQRKSFRIDTSALIKWATLTPELTPANSYFQDLQSFALRSEIEALSTQIDQISERIKDIAALKSVSLIQQQIKILMKMGAIHQTNLSGLKIQPVNLSEGGCSFLSQQAFTQDDQIALALVFPPGYFSLFTFARVRDCLQANEQFKVHLEFNELTEKQRQELVRFMFQAQTLDKKAGNLS
ncbi:MAG: PilZ domain-containing protein [Reinekea sp.]|jgi:hypothetical protein